MNKYDSFSLAHLALYISVMREKEGNKGIVFWCELKEALKECSTKKLDKEK